LKITSPKTINRFAVLVSISAITLIVPNPILGLPNTDDDLNTAIELINIGHQDKALPILDRAIKLSPNDWKLYTTRGRAWLGVERLQCALDDFNKGIKLDPNRSQIYEARALCYFEMHNLKAAIADQSKAIEMTPPDKLRRDRIRVRSKYYLEQGDSKHALADATDLILQNPKDCRWYLDRGDMYYALKQYQNAIADYTRGIEMGGNMRNLDYWYRQRAHVYTKLGKYNLADADRKKAKTCVNRNETLDFFTPPSSKTSNQ
jgi:tetratricopeptide (TPR) repeat protein